MKKNERWHGSFQAMGTDVEIDLVSGVLSEVQIDAIMQKIEIFFKNVELVFSRFRMDSELNYVNAHVGTFVRISPMFADVVRVALDFHERMDHFFDPRIYDALLCAGYDRDFCTNDLSEYHENCCDIKEDVVKSERTSLQDDLIITSDGREVMVRRKIDLSGIVKGWTVDRVCAIIESEGIVGYIIDAGGDMWAYGHDEHDRPWQIGIEGVHDDTMMMQIENEAVATSGITRRQWSRSGERYHHLIDPYDQKKFHFDTKTVTVIASSTVEADVLAKTLFLMSQEKRDAFIKKHAIKAIIIDQYNNISLSHYAKEHII